MLNRVISLQVVLWLIGSCLEDFDKTYLMSNPEKCEEIRTNILKNLQEYSSRRDPNPYSD